jgi:general secretion pathway protein E
MIGEKVVAGNVKSWEEINLAKGAGCNQCSNTGFKGRLGIYELIEVDDGVRKLISEHRDADVIEKEVIEKGMLTMLQDGFLKAVQGITSIEEVLRVTQE